MSLKNILKKFPIKIIIFEKRANHEFIFYDKGRREFKKTGEVRFFLKKKDCEIKPPDYDFIYQTNKGNILFLESPEPKVYIPLKKDEAKLKGTNDLFWLQWSSDRMKEQHSRWFKVSAWDKYLPVVSIVIVGIMSALMLVMVIGEMSKLAESMKGIGDGLGTVSRELVQAIKIMRPDYIQAAQSVTPP